MGRPLLEWNCQGTAEPPCSPALHAADACQGCLPRLAAHLPAHRRSTGSSARAVQGQTELRTQEQKKETHNASVREGPARHAGVRSPHGSWQAAHGRCSACLLGTHTHLDSFPTSSWEEAKEKQKTHVKRFSPLHVSQSRPRGPQASSSSSLKSSSSSSSSPT